MAAAGKPTALKHLTNRLLTSFLDEIDSDDVRKNMMDKLVAPTLKLLYTQLMPYLVVILALMVCMLVLMIMTFVLVALQYFVGRRSKVILAGFNS